MQWIVVNVSCVKAFSKLTGFKSCSTAAMTSQPSFHETHKPKSCFLRLAVQWSQIAKVIHDLLKNKQIKGISQYPWNLSVSVETKCKWLFTSVMNIDITAFISSVNTTFNPCSGPTNLRSSDKSKLPCNSQAAQEGLKTTQLEGLHL